MVAQEHPVWQARQRVMQRLVPQVCLEGRLPEEEVRRTLPAQPRDDDDEGQRSLPRGRLWPERLLQPNLKGREQ